MGKESKKSKAGEAIAEVAKKRIEQTEDMRQRIFDLRSVFSNLPEKLDDGLKAMTLLSESEPHFTQRFAALESAFRKDYGLYLMAKDFLCALSYIREACPDIFDTVRYNMTFDISAFIQGRSKECARLQAS